MPDLTVAQNLRLTRTPVAAVRRHLRELDLDIDFDEQAVDVPLPLLRMIDLARALARDPQLLILDEITAALPADLAERVFDVMRRQKESGRSALFITHRLREVIAHCDRATVLRDGGDVGTLVPQEGGEEKIVEYMLGEEVARAAGVAEATPERERIELAAGPTALEVRGLQVGETLSDVSLRAPAGRDPRDRGARGAGPGRALRRALRPAAPTGGDILVQGEAAACAPSRTTRSAPASCSSRPTGCRRCCRSARSPRTSPPRASTARAAGGRSACARSARACRARSTRSRSTRAPSGRCAGSRAATSRR